jgi:hypothetical protein
MKFYKEIKNYSDNGDYSSKIRKNNLTVIYNNTYYGSTVHFKNGVRHNDKNASYNGNGYKEFYLDGKHYGSKNKFTKHLWRKFAKLQAFL